MTCESRYVNGIPWMRCKAPLPADPLTALRFCGNMKMRVKYERLLSVGKIIKTIGCNLAYGYQRTYRIITVAPRDVYVYGYIEQLDSGACVLVLFDDPEDDEPEEKGCVRMNAFGGMLFTPYKDDPNKC